MKKIAFLVCLFSTAFIYGSAQNLFSYLASYDKVALYGLADSAGNMKTLGKYNLIGKPVNGISMVSVGMKGESDYQNARYGFVGPNGLEIMPPTYGMAKDFSEGMAAVASKSLYGSQWGFIDTKGKIVIDFQYVDVGSFSSGLAPVSSGKDKWSYVDQKGNVVIPGPFSAAEDFSEGLACVTVPYDMGSGVTGYHKGFVDTKGKMVIAPAYNYCNPFKAGVAIVAVYESPKNGPSKSYEILIDKTGKRLTAKEYVEIDKYSSEGLYAVKLNGASAIFQKSDTWGIIDKNGREIPGVVTGDRLYFSDGLARVQKDNKWGYMDKTGKLVIACKFGNALHFTEGMAAVKEDIKGFFGYINKKGEMVIAPQFVSAGNFNEGLAPVAVGKDFYDRTKKYGVIDKTGKTMIPFEYSSIEEFANGRAIAESNYITFYLYRNGKTSLASDALTLSEAREAILLMGKGDINGAFEILKRIEGKNYPPTQYYHGMILLQSKPPAQDLVKGADLVRKAAVGGYSEAMYTAAVLNLRTSPPDFTKAQEWFLKAEAAGVAAASRELGLLYEKGMGTTADAARAALFYQKAVDGGDAAAMYNLALLYRDGRGVTKNETRATGLINESAKRGYQPAKDMQLKMGK